MRLTVALALAAGLLAPAAAPALDVSGHLGLSWLQTDTWVERAAHQASPRLDLDLGAAAAGVLSSREVMTWQLYAAWRRVSQETDGRQTNLSRSLYFGGQASLFNSRRSPVALALDASRSFTHFSSSTATTVTGDTVVESYGSQASLRASGLPSLTLGYRWNGLQADSQGMERHTRTSQMLSAGTGFGASSFSLAASYAGELSDGSWTTDRYDTHRASVTARAEVAQGVQLQFEEQYLLTKPRSLEAFGSQRMENNAFRALLSNQGTFGDRHLVAYTSGRLISQAAGAPIAESTRQAVHYEGDLLLTSPTLFTRWILDGSLNQVRGGAVVADSSGETVGAQLWWRRQSEESLVELWAGPLVGFFQSSTLGDSTGWGASGMARAAAPWRGQNAGLSYRLDYGTDLYGAKGNSLRQALSASLSGGLLSGSYSATATASAARTYDPVLGAGADRTIALYLSARVRDVSADADVSLQEGTEGATPRDFIADGLFIPAPYDARTFQTRARATWTPFPGLSTTGQVRWLQSTHPGHPTIDQSEVLGSIDYSYGAFIVALEDRYGWNETSTGSFTVNQIMVRFYRQLSWGR